jgi:hypothetical protein
MSDFADFYAREKTKREIREAIEIIVADALEHFSADYVADSLLHTAIRLNFDLNYKAKRQGGWMDGALVSLRRLRDGHIETKDDLLREIANRNLNAKPGPIVN